MVKKTIIQVWGKQGSGKSGTIKITREELITKYINPSYSYTLPLPSGEISELLVCNGYKISIESMGDDLWSYGLNTRLNKHILTDNCDLLICASRVYNNVSAYLENMAALHNYRILKVTNYRSSDPTFYQDILNQHSARHLTYLVDQIVNGLL